MDPISPHPQTGTAARPGWWARNWKWFAPTGCLALIAMVLVFVALIVAMVFGAMKSTDVYKTAVATAKAHPAVTEALGTPVEEGMFLSGNTDVTDASGNADLSIPISGPKGKGKIFVVASKSAGRWTYSTMVVEIAQSGERIDLKADTDADEPLEE